MDQKVQSMKPFNKREFYTTLHNQENDKSLAIKSEIQFRSSPRSFKKADQES
jgi:hypothetical protein